MTRELMQNLLASPISKAYAEGKKIQWKSAVSDVWEDLDNVDPICIARFPDAYRIKPEPRQWWLNTYPAGLVIAHESKQSAESCASKASRIECIKVREVL